LRGDGITDIETVDAHILQLDAAYSAQFAILSFDIGLT
jgi:hypothetical protein